MEPAVIIDPDEGKTLVIYAQKVGLNMEYAPAIPISKVPLIFPKDAVQVILSLGFEEK